MPLKLNSHVSRFLPMWVRRKLRTCDTFAHWTTDDFAISDTLYSFTLEAFVFTLEPIYCCLGFLCVQVLLMKPIEIR